MFFQPEQNKAFIDNRLNQQQQQVVNQLGLGYGTFVVFSANELIGYGSTQGEALMQAKNTMQAKGQKPTDITAIRLGIVEVSSIRTPFFPNHDHDPTSPGATV